MAKQKLKSIQNGTRGGNLNLISIGDYYFDESGNWVDSSGNFILDESGNTINGGFIQVDEGMRYYFLEGDAEFYMKVTWGSGIFALPYPNTGGEPIVPVEIRVDHCVNYANINYASVQYQWPDSFNTNYTLNFSVYQGNRTISGMIYDTFSIPFSIHPHPNN